MKFTPYIYILFFLQLHLDGLSQNSKTLIIEGSNAYSSTIIKQIPYQKNILSDSILYIELKKFGKKLNRLGFLQHHLESKQKTDSVFTVRYLLNQNTNEVYITHSEIPYLINNKKLKHIDNRTVLLAFDKLDLLIRELLDYYQNNGYPFIKFYFDNIRTEKRIIKLDLITNKGLKRRIDSIVIKGYEKFPNSFIKQYFQLNKKIDFSQNTIEGISKGIQELAFVSEIKKPEVLFTKDNSTLYLYLKKKNNSSFDGLIGISSSEKNKALKLNGYLDLRIQNTLNYGERLDLKWVSDGNQSQTLKLSLYTPYILQSPFSSKYDFNIFKQDSTFLNIRNHLSLGYHLKNHQDIYISLSHQKSNSLINQSTSDITDYSGIFYGISYHMMKPNDHPIFKTKFNLKTYAGKGQRNNLDQNKIRNSLSLLINISKKGNLIIKNTTEVLFSKEYFINELFRLGGSNSIRGFDENSLLAKNYSYANIEYNYLINSNSYLSTLSDFGLLTNTLSESSLKTYSFGVGYTTKSKIGNLGVQYVIGNSSENPFSFTNSKLHFRLSQYF